MFNVYKSLIPLAISLTLGACGGGGSSSSDTKQPPAPTPENNAPVVSVENVNPNENTSVTLAVSASDADGDALTYNWSQTEGEYILFTENGSTITFNTPEVITSTDYSFEVSVSDGTTATKATVTVTVENVDTSPQVVLVETHFVAEAKSLTIEANITSEHELAIISWQANNTENVTLISSDNGTVTVETSLVDKPTAITLELTVTNVKGEESIQQTTVNIIDDKNDLVWRFAKHKLPMAIFKGKEFSSFVNDNIVRDVNGDGLVDIITAGPKWSGGEWSGQEVPIQVLINQGDNTVTNEPDTLFVGATLFTQIHNRQMIEDDFNNDGVDDIFFANTGKDTFEGGGEFAQLLMSNGSKLEDASSNLNWPVKGYYHGVASGDINGDGSMDLIMVDAWLENNENEEIIITLTNDGHGVFTPAHNLVPENLRKKELPQKWLWNSNKLHDFDGDGCDDLVLNSEGHQWNDSYIAWNKCDGTGFVGLSDSYALPHAGEFVRTVENIIVDINNDGLPDLMSAMNKENYNGKYFQVLQNNGDKTFVDKTAQYFPNPLDSEKSVFRIYSRDLDNDGDNDLVFLVDATGDVGEPHLVMENKGSHFALIDDPDSIISGSLTPVDWDNDGDIDIVSRAIKYIGTEHETVTYWLHENLSNN